MKAKILCWVAAVVLGAHSLPVQSAQDQPRSSAPASSAPAAETSTSDNEPPPSLPWLRGQGKSGASPPGDDTNLTYQMLVYVVVILALGAIAILFMKKVLPRLGVSVPSGRHISIEETAYLGPKSTVYLLRVGSRHVLIGKYRESLVSLGDVTNAFDSPEEESRSGGQIKLDEES